MRRDILLTHAEWSLQGGAPGDRGILHQLGLRVGDVLVQSNGVDLDDLDAIADLAVDLFYDSPAPWFTLTYQRRTTTTQLTIVVD